MFVFSLFAPFVVSSLSKISPAVFCNIKMGKVVKKTNAKKKVNLKAIRKPKRKHTTISIKDKVEVLQRLEKGEIVKALCLEFGVGESTIKDWMKKKTEFSEFMSSTLSLTSIEKRKTLKNSSFKDVDEALYLWFLQQRQLGTPLDGPILQAQAGKLNQLLNKDREFKASDGWFSRWKKRHGIRFMTITGEKLSADLEAAEKFVKSFPTLVAGLSPQQIYNADESGLVVKALPERSFAAPHEKDVAGFKENKQRVTIMACSNASENHKLRLMFIGKSAKPRALRNENFNELSVFYRNQTKSWMNRELFGNWFCNEFVPSVKKFLSQKNLPEEAILLLDNAPAHPCGEELKSG